MAISTVNGSSAAIGSRRPLHDPSIQSFAILDGDKLHITFRDSSFMFHAQWLHDARITKGPSRSASEAFTVKPADAKIESAVVVGQGNDAKLLVTWADGSSTGFPHYWLRLWAPVVAKTTHALVTSSLTNGYHIDGHIHEHKRGWTVDSLSIPEIDYNFIFPEGQDPTAEDAEKISVEFIDQLFHSGGPEIVKIVNTPPADIEGERNKKGTLVTKVLKQVFGSVFVHPRRGLDETFNISSKGANVDDANRGKSLHNYNTDTVLLTHCDHAHYDYPAQVQGLYCLEGQSYNTFVSSLAALETMLQEVPDLYPYLSKSAMVVGRVANFYDPPMFQATVDPAVTMTPGFAHLNDVKRVRWHPHLAGSLAAPYDEFHKARQAYQKFQEILRRPSHQLTFVFKPGDLFVWNNFHLLHGRESVIEEAGPRTSVGQTVPEQVVSERYRSLQIKRLKKVADEDWLVHVPTDKLYDVARMLGV